MLNKLTGFILSTSLNIAIIGGAVLIVEKIVQNTAKTMEVLRHG